MLHDPTNGCINVSIARASFDKQSERVHAYASVRVETRSGGLIDEQIGEFERAQMAGASARSIGADVARKEEVLRELQREQSLRGSGTGALKNHLRRLVSI